MKKASSIFGSLLIIFSLVFGKAVQYSPNRVESGKYYGFFEFFNSELYGLAAALLLVLALALLMGALLTGKFRFSAQILSIVPFLIGVLLMLFTANAILRPEFNQFEFGRISLGGGFWIVFAGVTVSAWGAPIYRNAVIAGLMITLAVLLISGFFNSLSIVKEFVNRADTFWGHVLRHFLLSVLSVAVAIIIGVPTGVYIHKSDRPNRLILFILNLGQTIPTLALLGLLIIPLGVGVLPAFIVLILYALFPIVHNTVSGLKMVDRSIIEAASGIGMRSKQIFWKIKAPLSLPVTMGGIRTALTQSIGNTILAGLIGGGGLGSIIFLGLAQSAPDLIMIGVIPLVAMAFILDIIALTLIKVYERFFLGHTVTSKPLENGVNM